MLKKIFQLINQTTQSEKGDTNTSTEPEKLQLPNLVSRVGFYAEVAEKVAVKVYQATRHFPASVGTHHNYPQGLWDHSLKVALACSSRFKETRYALIAFLVGLLHDVGKIACFQYQSGYTYNPLTLKKPPQDAKLVGMEKEHEKISCCMIYYFLADVIDIFTAKELMQIHDAILYHHSTVIIENNDYLDVLREADQSDASNDIKEHSTTANSPSVIENKSQSEESETLKVDRETLNQLNRDSVDLFAFRTTIRKMIAKQQLVSDYHFYITTFNNINVLLITLPKAFADIITNYNTELNTMLHESVFVEALDTQKWIALNSVTEDKSDKRIVKANIKINAKTRTLKFLALYANKIFSQDEIRQYYTQAESVKIKAQIVNTNTK